MILKTKKNVLRKEITEMYKNDEQFNMMVSEYGQKAGNELIERLVNSRIESEELSYNRSISAYGQYYSIYYCSVPLKQQINSYYCGPATALQTLYGLGLQGSVSGTTDAQKQTTLATAMGTNSQDGTYVYKLTQVLNSYISTKKYSYVLGSSSSYTTFENDIIHSLFNDRPVILHARTEYLSYYGGHKSGHYISLDAWDARYDSAELKDCNYDNKYFGTHSVPGNEVKAAVSDVNRYYIFY
ncbi:hypothetical protein ciss_15300 [Carboxydothermus islandicus]|uniref:Peptidase C39-like domain-containing protein n=1 Tax=Carboxydothermus islandicus TaxID=661089 RepID=A0A1L8D3B1_9THEO|nr:hypothetical protein [Carboxydothermus islandicus]GAV25597.1 hypothetical protein ciss_15300 [Carboxydothermus islandicus]